MNLPYKSTLGKFRWASYSMLALTLFSVSLQKSGKKDSTAQKPEEKKGKKERTDSAKTAKSDAKGMKWLLVNLPQMSFVLTEVTRSISAKILIILWPKKISIF